MKRGGRDGGGGEGGGIGGWEGWLGVGGWGESDLVFVNRLIVRDYGIGVLPQKSQFSPRLTKWPRVEPHVEFIHKTGGGGGGIYMCVLGGGGG